MSLIQRVTRLKYLSLFSFLLILFSCRKTDTTSSGTSGDLFLNKTAIRIDTAIGTTDSFTVQSTVQWTASISPGADWLRIDKSSGSSGNTGIKLTIVSNNPNISTQTATITVTAVGSTNIPSVKLTVTKRSYIFSLGYHKELGGTNDESALRSTVKTPDGGIIVVGGTSSNNGDVHGNHGDADVWIVKLNANGDTAWTKTYGGSADESASSVTNSPDGGYLVCGNTASVDGDVHVNRGGTDIWLLKLDMNGDTLWTKTYGGSNIERANAIIPTDDGGYAVTGFTASNDGDIHNNQGGGDVWILKIDATGDTLWSKTYGGSQWDEADAITATADGGYVVAGLTNSNDQDVIGFHVSPFFSFDMWIVRLDASGNKLWARTLGGAGNDVALSLIQVTDGFVLTGYTTSNDGDVTGHHGRADLFNDMLVAKINANGTIVWAKTFGGTFDDEGIAVTATPDGGYAIAGGTASQDGDVTSHQNDQGAEDMWVVKLSADGTRQWTKTIGGTSDEIAGAIIPVTGGYIISGFTQSNDGDLSGSGNHGNYDIFVVKLLVD